MSDYTIKAFCDTCKSRNVMCRCFERVGYGEKFHKCELCDRLQLTSVDARTAQGLAHIAHWLLKQLKDERIISNDK